MVQQVVTPDLIESFHLNDGWMLKTVDIRKSGGEIILDASLDWNAPEATQFQLFFENCRYTSWEVVEPVDQELAAHQVTGFNLYNDPEGKSAVIHTPEFELTVTYGELIIQYQEA